MAYSTPRQLQCVEAVFIFCILSYVITKAFLIPITYDEAYTIAAHVPRSVASIMQGALPSVDQTNNHLLNTLLVKLMMQFGNAPLLVRIPSIIGCILFLIGAKFLAKCVFKSNGALRTLLFMALALNPMLAEFFALARGYSLSLAFMICALGQLMYLSDNATEKWRGALHLCFIFGVLTVYSNFSLLLPTLCIGGLATFSSFQRQEDSNTATRIFKTLIAPLGYSMLLCLLIYKPISYLIAAHAFYHGGRKNFILDTWGTMISDFIGLRPRNFDAFDSGNYFSWRLVFWICLSLLVMLAAIVATLKYKPAFSFNKLASLFPLLILIGCIAGINAQFYLQGIPLINYRIALYLYPLSVLVIFSALQLFSAVHLLLAQRIGLTFVLLLCINYCLQLKITYTTEWMFDAYNRKVCAWIAQDRKKYSNAQKAHVYTFILMQPSTNFYIHTQYSNQIDPIPEIVNVADIKPLDYDYIYLPRIIATMIHPPFKVVQAYEDSTYLLFKQYHP